MSSETGRQSSGEVAHEAEDTRAHLASTLEQLRTNLKPENVMEEVVSNARIGASSVADSLVGLGRDYPLPAVLIAAGAALVMGAFTKGRGRSGTPNATTRASMLRNPARFVPAPGREGSRSRAGIADPAAMTGKVRDAASGLKSQVSDGIDGLKQKASDALETTSSNARDVMQNASRYIPHDRSEVKSKLSNLLEEQPLILGAIGLAVGAAVGAALPITRTEDNLMGSTAHSVRQAAQDTARQEVTDLKNVANETFENVKKSASDHGLSTDNLSDFARDVGSQAKTAVHQVGGSLDPEKHKA